MRARTPSFILACLTVTGTLVACPASAGATEHCGEPHSGVEFPLTLAANDHDTLGQYSVHVPQDWNGTLLVTPFGGTDLTVPYFGALPPGLTVEDVRIWNQVAALIDDPSYPSAVIADPTAFPIDPGTQTLVQPGGPLPNPPYATQLDMREELETRGYAVAMSFGTPEQTEGLRGTFGGHRLEQARRMVAHFRDTIAMPCTTIAMGASGGGLVAPLLAERYPGLVDGAIGDSATTRLYPMLQQFAALAVLVDELFGWPATWGTPEAPAQASFLMDVVPTSAGWAVDPANDGRLELLRYFRGVESADVWRDSQFWGGAQNIQASYLLPLAAAVEYGDIIGLSHFDYSAVLTPAQEAAVEALDPTLDVDAVLAAVQARTGAMTADPGDLVAAWPTVGNNPFALARPTIKIVHESAGVETVEMLRQERLEYALAGRSGRYFGMVAGPPYNHGSSTVDQTLDALAVLENWIASGVRPTAASFPGGHGWLGELTPALPRWL